MFFDVLSILFVVVAWGLVLLLLLVRLVLWLFVGWGKQLLIKLAVDGDGDDVCTCATRPAYVIALLNFCSISVC